MTDLIDCAATETDAYIADCIHRQRKPVEIPDEDESGRYCLGCGITIDPRRIEKAPEAVRCVPCESIIEKMGNKEKGKHGR
ncbi:TraR/DksA family transcriptional regulator [Photobacterium minamisatsumaniensis]|uniref:TraR/DksA family transcriptional regulator n=1 Tax=Photobacterium minamisatsumaniensis TaxID=2910233 RepID=UPI003D0C7E83